jgi:hypothetical protein
LAWSFFLGACIVRHRLQILYILGRCPFELLAQHRIGTDHGGLAGLRPEAAQLPSHRLFTSGEAEP